MTQQLAHRLMFVVSLVCQSSVCLGKEAPAPANPNSYLNAVREFADNVLKYGRDTYGPKQTPLFVDGLNVNTHEPVKWIAPNGDRWILSNLASQQNLFRTLDGLTRITGDPKYKQAAMDAIKYAFENLRSPNGLLYWGGHSAYDVGADKPCGRGIHEFKGLYPYYELMWEVNPQATKQFVDAFWSGHILDWSTLDMDRHCYNMTRPLNKPWNYEYKGGPVFFGGSSFGFMNAGGDLFRAAALLTKLSGDKEPLIWGKRLAHRYIEARNPKTGINPGVFSGKLTPDMYEFPYTDFSNPALWQNTRYYYMQAPQTAISPITREWLCQFFLGEMLDDEGKDFTRWAHEELTAIGKMCYRKQDNTYVPISEDGTSREGYLCTSDGVMGLKGTKLTAIPAIPYDFWAYAVAYCLTDDVFMWEIARSIAVGNRYGDIGAGPAEKPRLNSDSILPDPYGLLGFLELYRKTGNQAFLTIAKRIADTILVDRFQHGFFVGSAQNVFCKFDAIDPLTLLHLYMVASGQTKAHIPKVWPGTSFFDMAYRNKEEVIDNLIYTQNEFFLPVSLQEAAAIGDLGLVQSIFEKGAHVDGREDTFLKSALHRAAMNDHKDVAEFLLGKSADIDARDAGGVSALHYAVDEGHNEMAELLIAKGANVNAENNSSDTSLHYAVWNRDFRTVRLLVDHGARFDVENQDGWTAFRRAAWQRSRAMLELFVSKGADISTLHAAACIGDLARVKSFLEQGIDVDTKDKLGWTPLYWAACTGQMEIAEFLITKGADVQAKTNDEETPLHRASFSGSEELVRQLISKNADVNAKDKNGDTPLHNGVSSGNWTIVELLLVKGANINVQGGNNRTPLHLAVMVGKNEIVEVLISKGADVNAKDAQGLTPLQLAESQKRSEILELLRKHQANKVDSTTNTPQGTPPRK